MSDQNRQYQEELRLLTLKVNSNSAVSSTVSFPNSGVNTNSSAGSNSRQHMSYSSSSGVSSVSPAFPSDDRFLVQRKPKRTDLGNELDRSIDDNNHHRPYQQLERSPGDIVLFDKSHIDDCPIISSSSTSFARFQEGAPKKCPQTGKKRRKNFWSNKLRKRLRRAAKYCAPCLKQSDDSDDYDNDTSLLYTGLDGEMASNSRYNSFN